MTDKPKLGEILVSEGLISEFQLRAALGEQARWGNRLGETLVQMGFLGEQELVRTLSRCFDVPGVNLDGKTIGPDVIDMVPVEVAEKSRCLPLFQKTESGTEVLYLGMDDPCNLAATDDVSFRTGFTVRPVLIGPLQLRTAIAFYYRGESPAACDSIGLTEALVIPGDTAPLLGPEPVDDMPQLDDSSFRDEPCQELEVDDDVTAEPLLTEPEVLYDSEDDTAPEPVIAAEPLPEAEPPLPEPELSADPVPVAEPASLADPAFSAMPESREPDHPQTQAHAPLIEPAPAAQKPHEIPTRQILWALTRLLVEKGIISRDELMTAVHGSPPKPEPGTRD